QGRRTGVLALNLASLLLGTSDPARALVPATRAYELAASSDSGVDPLQASLILGRAQLAANQRSSDERLGEAIAAAEAAGQALGEAYDAAVALGEWAIRAERFSVVQPAWAAAGRLAEQSSGEIAFNRGRARLLEGLAIFLGGIDDDKGQALRGIASPDAHAAYYAFTEARALFEPYAYPEAANESLTQAQSAFAQTLGWRGALLAKLASQNQALEPTPPEHAALVASEIDPQYCRLRAIAEPKPTYPKVVANQGGVGAVVVHIGLDADGNIVKRQIAAVAPTGPLREAVEAVFEQWRFERHPASAPDCR